MVSALDSGSRGPVSSPFRGHCVVFLGKNFNLTMPLSTQVYKWVRAALILKVALRWTSILSRGKWKYSQSVHATKKLVQFWPLSLSRNAPLSPRAERCVTERGARTGIRKNGISSGLMGHVARMQNFWESV